VNNCAQSTEATHPALAQAISVLRERSRQLLRTQDDRLRQLEAKLEQQLAAALERFEHEPREIAESEQELFDRVESLEREVRRLQQLRQESEQALDEARQMLGELESERQTLRRRLDDMEQRAESGEPAVPGDTEETERLHRRLELAMQEIRDLKAGNDRLTDQLQRAPAPRSVDPGRQFDWESQKKRLLEQLETSFDSNDPQQAEEKLRCEDVVRETARIIAEKDREIAELRRQLEERPEPAPPPQESRPAAEELLDADAVIQSERARLAKLQGEWEEKLRQAEVEVSIERAKIARERLQLEEKLRMLESKPGADGGTSQGADSKGGRGRWLNRLGLGSEKHEK
jgi:chromosome segregation ATPase